MDERYSRQILFRPVGELGQRHIQESTVGIIGCGALGTALAETLTRAGIGQLYLVDRDYVEFSNLQRQQLFTEQDAIDMVPKVIAAEKRLKMIRTDMKLVTYLQNADGFLLEQLAQKCDLLLDATDNFETRLLINDAALKYRIPWIYGACVGSSGVVFPFIPRASACFRCLLPALPSLNQTCDTVGVLAPAVQTTAALQGMEALKWLSDNHHHMRKKVHYFDLWESTTMDIGISRLKRAECPTCGDNPIYPALQDSSQEPAVLCGRNAVQILPDLKRPLTLDHVEQVACKLQTSLKRTPYFAELHAFDRRIIVFTDGRLLIHGAKTAAEGKKIYHQLFG
ncbi:ThiF family adenylyltransferase [Metasolibacillus sp.]|uniref:ThiF family adenylyltransferase n=1 Tax=Metasolibacillus sp. TaxID=2703680 RepID=UPI0025FF04CA|nr:ThiF family adenylyltransferase [Metasolibacillus sp.]MCT6924281.1 ThiF family adenylyltransferase [Metasolibacillus sp.]MCT6940317.1 ThiF family adenylyltransferase [Metasolibacillus sp.]